MPEAQARDPQRVEALGPAERIIQSLTTYIDHMYHGRPGVVTVDPVSPTGIQWQPASWKLEDGQKVVYREVKGPAKGRGKKPQVQKIRIGVLGEDNQVRDDMRRVVAEYRLPGLVPEIVTWLYQQVADIWTMDNEFAARWGSWAFAQDHRDTKVVLAAFLLVQNRCGDPVIEGGEVIFHDDDFREVGEALCLLTGKDYLNAKQILRIGDVLRLQGVGDINRKLGFGRSARNPALGRYNKAVTAWLRYRELNPKMLQGLVDSGFSSTVQKLARRVGYKPETEAFFEILRWKQTQAKDGRRTLAIGKEVAAAESWDDLDERSICELITLHKPNYKRIVGLLPARVGLTRAIMAAAIEANSLSNADLIILSPTIEELGLLAVPAIKARWEKAVNAAENSRAARIAERMKGKENAEKLAAGADKAAQKAVAEVMRDMRVYFFVDISGSMHGAIERARAVLPKLLPAFPPDKLKVAVFNSVGREVQIRHWSGAGVENAFKGYAASGGTSYGNGVLELAKYKPAPEEDVLFLFVGDEEDSRFAGQVRQSGLRPTAFGFLNVKAGMPNRYMHYDAVRGTAGELGIPCFMFDEKMFEDVYAVPRILRNLIAATPVGQPGPGVVPVKKRESLIETILKTDLLIKPAWAA